MIAVIGGSGFLGQHVLRALQDQRADFLVLLRSPILRNGIPKERQKVVNFRSVEEIQNALQGANQILHLAGRINDRREGLREANPNLLSRVIEAAQRGGVRRLLYMSSVAAQFRLGSYGETKWEAEEILKSSRLPYLIFRSTLLYGTGDTKNVAMMEKMLRHFPALPLLGGGKFLIQPLYVEDAVFVLTRAFESAFENRTYNLAGPAQISLKEMVEILADSLGKKARMVSIPLKPVQALVRLWAALFPATHFPVKQILELDQHRAFDIEETRKDFGFAPRSFQEGVRAMRASELLCVG